MYQEQRIQNVEKQNKLIIELLKEVNHKLDCLSKNKSPEKKEFEEINAAGYYTNKQVQKECALSERGVHNFLSEYEGEIRRQEFAGYREHFIHLGDFKDAKQKGRKDFDREVFNRPKQKKAA